MASSPYRETTRRNPTPTSSRQSSTRIIAPIPRNPIWLWSHPPDSVISSIPEEPTTVRDFGSDVSLTNPIPPSPQREFPLSQASVLGQHGESSRYNSNSTGPNERSPGTVPMAPNDATRASREPATINADLTGSRADTPYIFPNARPQSINPSSRPYRDNTRSSNGSSLTLGPQNGQTGTYFPTVVTFVPEAKVGKLQKEPEDLIMDTLLCRSDMSYQRLKRRTLRATKRVEPMAADVEVHLGRWVGLAAGKHSLQMLHRIRQDNYIASLLVLQEKVGEFGVVAVPKLRESPGIITRLWRKISARKHQQSDSE